MFIKSRRKTKESIDKSISFIGVFKFHGFLEKSRNWTNLPIEFSAMEQNWTPIIQFV
jgi:hypothetical protein